MALRGPRAYLGKVKKSQGVILRLSALKFKIKITDFNFQGGQKA